MHEEKKIQMKKFKKESKEENNKGRSAKEKKK